MPIKFTFNYMTDVTQSFFPFSKVFLDGFSIAQFALPLDRKGRSIGNWKHLGQEMEVGTRDIRRLEWCSEYSPTVRLFEFLSYTPPEVSFQRLRMKLLEVKRTDRFSWLITAGNILQFKRL